MIKLQYYSDLCTVSSAVYSVFSNDIESPIVPSLLLLVRLVSYVAAIVMSLSVMNLGISSTLA